MYKSNKDLYSRISNDTNFRLNINKLFGRFQIEAAEAAKGRPGAEEKRDKTMMELFQYCGWNVGIFFPLFFPKMIEGGPLNVMRRPFGFMMTELNVSGYTCIRGSRQIAKSTNLVGRQLVKGFLFPRFKSMYICPHNNHKKTYQNRFAEMEAACPFMDFVYKNPRLRTNLSYKQYPLEGEVNIVNCLTDSSQARSKTTDELLYDEYQLFDWTLEGDIRPCQSVSKIPMTVYAGTSTTVDSPLEFRYQEGSQHTWKVRSPNGKDWIDFGDEELMIKCIRPRGLVCPYTERPLNVAQGEYTPTYKDRHEYGYTSIHVPQLIIKDKVEHRIDWAKIYEAFEEFDRPKFMEEFLGIPSELGAREITEADLKAICTLGSKDEVFERVKRGDYSIIVSGFDWGGSDHIPHIKASRVSFTANAVLGLSADGYVDILHMRQHHGMNYDFITGQIAEDYRKYQCNALACDAAGGQVYLNNLDKLLNHKTNFRFGYHAHVFQLMGVPSHGAPNHYTLNKHESIAQLFQAIKHKKIRCYKWEESGPRLSEILNVQRVLIEPQSGPPKYHYHMTPRNPDDTVHALNYSYILMRLLAGENVVHDERLMRTIQQAVRGENTFSPFQTFGGVPNLFGEIVSG
jgi:hypothetical protein